MHVPRNFKIAKRQGIGSFKDYYESESDTMQGTQIGIQSIDAANRALILQQVGVNKNPNPSDSRGVVESHAPDMAVTVVRCSARQDRGVKDKKWLTDEEIRLYDDAAQDLATSRLRIGCHDPTTFFARRSPPRNVRPDCQLCPPIYDTYSSGALFERAGWAERALTVTQQAGASHTVAGADVMPQSSQSVAAHALEGIQQELADNSIDEENRRAFLLQGASLLDIRSPLATFSASLQQPPVVRPWDRRDQASHLVEKFVPVSNFRDVVLASAAMRFIAQRDSSRGAPAQPPMSMATRSAQAPAAMPLVASETSARVVPTMAATADGVASAQRATEATDGAASARRATAATVTEVPSSHGATTRSAAPATTSNIMGSSASAATAAASDFVPAVLAFRSRSGTSASSVGVAAGSYVATRMAPRHAAVANPQITHASAAKNAGAAKLSGESSRTAQATPETAASIRPLRRKSSGNCNYYCGVSSAAVIDAFQCSICANTCVDLASTPCGHNFCLVHLRKWVRTKAPRASCPVCRARIQQREADVCVNTAVNGVIVAAQRARAVQQQRMQIHGYVPPS